MYKMLRFLLFWGIGQSLAVLSHGQQDLANGQAKYNGPSHQYLPAAAVNRKDILPSTRDSLQRYQGPPQYNDYSQKNPNYPPQATDKSAKSQDYDLYTFGPYHRQQSTGVEQNRLPPHATGEDSYYQNPDQFNNYPHSTSGQTPNPCPSTFTPQRQNLYHKSSRKSYLAFIIPPPTTSSTQLTTATPSPSPPPPSTSNATHFQGSKPYNHPPRKSQLSFIIPEITTTSNRDTANQSKAVPAATDSKDIRVPSQEYLAPLESFSSSQRSQEPMVSTTTTVSPSYTSRYHGPSNQYLPATTEAASQTTSPPYYSIQKQNFGSFPNNRPWNPIKTERPTTTKRPQTGSTPMVLQQGYRYNTPAQRHPSPNSPQTVNGINYNELGMGMNTTSKDQQVIETNSNNEDKTEIQTEQGYVYGQTESPAMTHLKTGPTIPSSYHYYRPGERLVEKPVDRYQTQQGDKAKESLRMKPSSSPIQYESQSATNSFSIGNGKVEANLNHKSQQIQREQELEGRLSPNSEGFEQHRPSTDPAQYEQQFGSNSYPNGKGNYEKPNTQISLQKPVESLRPTVESSYEYRPSFGTERDEQQMRTRKYPAKPGSQEGQTLQKPVANVKPTTRYSVEYTPSSGTNIPAVNSEANTDLNFQPMEISRPSTGSSPFKFVQYDPDSTPTVIPNRPANFNENWNYDFTQNQQESMGNLGPSSGASSENGPSAWEHYEQQQNKDKINKYYSTQYPYPSSETFQPSFYANSPSSKDVKQSATSSVNKSPFSNLQYSHNHQELSFQESQGNNLTNRPVPKDVLVLPVDIHPWHSTLSKTQKPLTQNPVNLNIFPIPQEDLQKFPFINPTSSLPLLGLLPPTLTESESQKYYIAGHDQLPTNNQNSLNSKLSLEPRTEYQSYPISKQVTASSQDQNPLTSNSQGQFPQLLSGFTPLQTSSEHITSQTFSNQQVFHLNRNPLSEGSLVLQGKPSLSQSYSGKLNTPETEISQTNPLGNFAYHYTQPTQSPFALSSEIPRPSSQSLFSFNSNNVPTNSKLSLQSNKVTQRNTPTFPQTPQSLAGSTNYNSESQSYRTNHNEFQSPLPQTEEEKLDSSLNQMSGQNPSTTKQFAQQNQSGSENSYQQQQLFLENSQNTALQVPGTSTVSSFFGPSGSVLNTASGTTANASNNLNPSKTVTSQPKPINFLKTTNYLQMPSHSYIVNSFYTMHPGQLAQGQQSESVKQPPNPRDHSMSKPIVFVDSPPDATPSPNDISKPMVFVESPPAVENQKLVRQPHLAYGSPIQEPSNGHLPPSPIV